MSDTEVDVAGADTVTATMQDGLTLISSSRDGLLASSSAPPPTLFRYTSTEPAVNIIESNEPWATNAVFKGAPPPVPIPIALKKRSVQLPGTETVMSSRNSDSGFTPVIKR
jgi:hypothetical protein